MPILGNVVHRALKVRQKIRFRQGEPVKYQHQELRKLLTKARDTAIGRHYDFASILRAPDMMSAFRQAVPLHNYKSMYQNWWKRSMDGEANVFWPGKVKYYALSSGTSESASKYIPVTNDMLKAITRASIKQFYSMANFNLPPGTFEKGVFTLGSSTSLIRKGDYFVGDMSGISAKHSIPFWVGRFFKPGKEIMRIRAYEDKLNAIATQAPEWDISIMCGIPSWVQLTIEKILERHNAKTIHDIWPNLNVYIHGGIAFDSYRKKFDSFLGRPITFIETYMASEGFFGFRAVPDVEGIHFLLNNGHYFEFVPFNSNNFNEDGELDPNAHALHIGEIQAGIDYAVIISTVGGAWRYLIGDTVKFVNIESKEFIISGRTKHYLSISGEHLSVDNMNKAVGLVADELGVSINEFTVAGIPFENLFAHKWYIGTDDNIDPLRVREALDRHLCTVNDDYEWTRGTVLKDIQVEVVPVQYFYNYLKATAKLGDQVKFPRVLKKERFAEWEAFVAAQRKK